MLDKEIEEVEFEFEAVEKKKAPRVFTAKKDWLIVQNEYRLEIKKGDVLKDVPERFIAALKTEGVID